MNDSVLATLNEHGVLRLTLNRPAARNAINWTMRRELERLDVRVPDFALALESL